MRVLIIDNYDSFVYNLAQYLGEEGCEVIVFRNDQITLEEMETLNPSRLVISPGPGRPEDAGLSVEAILRFAGRIPILGVCLGHQCIGYAFGGEIVSAKELMHGKVSKIFHTGEGIFRGLPTPIEGTRYHSLAVKRESLPSCFKVTAWTEDGEIMGLMHREFPIHGVQFHPESIATSHGKEIIRNFIKEEV